MCDFCTEHVPESTHALGVPGVALVSGSVSAVKSSGFGRSERPEGCGYRSSHTTARPHRGCRGNESPQGHTRNSADRIAKLRPMLAAQRRSVVEMPVLDDPEKGVRSTLGRASPVAPPFSSGAPRTACKRPAPSVLPSRTADESPGGTNTLLLDQVLGHTVAAAKLPGVTAELILSYRCPVPLQEPLLFAGRMIGPAPESPARRVLAEATILTQADSDVVLGSTAVVRSLEGSSEGIGRTCESGVKCTAATTTRLSANRSRAALARPCAGGGRDRLDRHRV